MSKNKKIKKGPHLSSCSIAEIFYFLVWFLWASPLTFSKYFYFTFSIVEPPTSSFSLFIPHSFLPPCFVPIIIDDYLAIWFINNAIHQVIDPPFDKTIYRHWPFFILSFTAAFYTIFQKLTRSGRIVDPCRALCLPACLSVCLPSCLIIDESNSTGMVDSGGQFDPNNDLAMDIVVPKSESFRDVSITSSLSTPEADADALGQDVIQAHKRKGGRKPVRFSPIDFMRVHCSQMP